MSDVVLQTATDEERERVVIRRIELATGWAGHRLGRFSRADYVMTSGGNVVCVLELKIRKESPQTVRGYGPLWLKERKRDDLLQIAELLRVDVWVVFAFNNGTGPMGIVNARVDGPVVIPARRRNFRDLATDQEPVIEVGWDQVKWPEVSR